MYEIQRRVGRSGHEQTRTPVMAVAAEEHASFWRRHVVLVLVVALACVLGVIILIQSLGLNVELN